MTEHDLERHGSPATVCGGMGLRRSRAVGAADGIAAAVTSPAAISVGKKKIPAVGGDGETASGWQVADLAGENSNSLFEVLEDWEAQLKPFEGDLPELDP